MEDVARASGAGKGTLYRYFASKEALYAALLLGGIDRLRGEIAAAAAGASDPIARIEAVVRAVLAHLWARRRLLALLHEHEHALPRAQGRERIRRRAEVEAAMTAVVAGAIAEGVLRPQDAAFTAELLLGMLRAAHRARRPDDDADAVARRVVELFLLGAANPAGRSGFERRRRMR